MSRNNQSSISLSRLISLSLKHTEKLIIIVGKVLNDDRILKIPNIRICALKTSVCVRKRIIAAGGEVFTLDKLPILSPIGKKVLLLRGPKKAKKNS